MRQACTLLRVRQLILALTATFSLATASTGNAAGSAQPLRSSVSAAQSQHDGVLTTADGSIHLLAQALPPPAVEHSFTRYGFYISAAQPLATPTYRVAVSYSASRPPATALQVDVRASADGQRWTAWETDVASGATVEFPQLAQMVQYRVSLFGTPAADPSLQGITIQGLAAPARYHTLADEVAPTFRVRATRMGMTGGRTANGWIIPPRAHFVSLPSWRSLSSKNGREYQVRVTYRGRSAVAPVMDVGPWNTRDDYWSASRERYKDLARGWPQDHAAYFEKHNNGWAEKGYVRFPTAIDIGDGVWWDVLGIKGDQAEVEVTFLWLGRDPLAVPVAAPAPPDHTATEVTVDDLSPAFKAGEATWYHSPDGCGEGKHAYWTYSSPDQAQSENHARWQPALPAERLYDVYVHVPICPGKQPPTAQARYLVQHRDGATEVVVDQAKQTSWVLLGRFPFAAGDGGFVQLTDVTGEELRTIWFDQAKWVAVP